MDLMSCHSELEDQVIHGSTVKLNSQQESSSPGVLSTIIFLPEHRDCTTIEELLDGIIHSNEKHEALINYPGGTSFPIAADPVTPIRASASDIHEHHGTDKTQLSDSPEKSG